LPQLRGTGTACRKILAKIGLDHRVFSDRNLKQGEHLLHDLRKIDPFNNFTFLTGVRTLLRSQSYLGAQYRRLRTRLGAPKAITAMARKLACLYRLIRHGHQYVDKGTEYYEARYREQQIRWLTKRAQKLGLQLVIPQIVST
jgi:hypothetical protein